MVFLKSPPNKRQRFSDLDQTTAMTKASCLHTYTHRLLQDTGGLVEARDGPATRRAGNTRAPPTRPAASLTETSPKSTAGAEVSFCGNTGVSVLCRRNNLKCPSASNRVSNT